MPEFSKQEIGNDTVRTHANAAWRDFRRHDTLVRAVRRACSVTLCNWATTTAVADELAKEDFVRDINARLNEALEANRIVRGWASGQPSWRAR